MIEDERTSIEWMEQKEAKHNDFAAGCTANASLFPE